MKVCRFFAPGDKSTYHIRRPIFGPQTKIIAWGYHENAFDSFSTLHHLSEHHHVSLTRLASLQTKIR